MPAPQPKPDEEQTEHLEVAVAVDELLHAHYRALHKELQHASVTVGIAQPVGKVVFRDAVLGAVVPLQAHHPGRQADTSQLAGEVYQHREKQQRRRPREQRAVGSAAKQRQQHAHEGIEHQYVAAPDEHEVQETDGQQYGHAAVEDAETACSPPLGVGHYDGETNAEEEREDGVELAVNEHVLQEAHHAVNTRRRHGGRGRGRQERVQRELGEVGHGYAHEGEAAQYVEYGETLFLSHGHGRAAMPLFRVCHIYIVCLSLCCYMS